MIIRRPEAKFINKSKKWVLLYGRRKTGKTFLIKNFVKYDEYFFVKRDRTIINKRVISYETFLELIREYIKNNKTVVVDEFHRLGDDFLDFLHSLGRGGKLILVSSTLYLSKKILSSRSPLLGLVSEVNLGLISLDLCFKEINKLFNKKESLELSIFCREPINIDYINKKPAREIIVDIILATKNTVPALIGEIFIEEERQISKIYEGILRAVSIGKNKAGEIANYLFFKKLIKKESSTMIQQYLKNLVEFGILKKILIFNKKEYNYDLSSPLMKFYFYSDEKYNFSEEANREKANLVLNELIPKLVESNVREYITYKYGLIEAILSEKEREIDLYLIKFKKPYLVGEIKWRKIDKKDLRKAEDKLKELNVKKKVLFLQDKKGVSSNVLQIIDIEDLFFKNLIK